MSANDELVTEFLAVTGATDPSTATNYIEMSGGNLETAVGLYMEHNGGGGGGGRSGANASGGDAVMAGNAGFDVPGAGLGMEEDDIRAPDETRTMRLMDEGHMMGGSAARAAGMIYGNALAMDPSTMRMMHEMMEEQLSPSAFGPGSSRVGSARDAVDRATAGESKDDIIEVSGGAGSNENGEFNYEDDEDDDYEMETEDIKPPQPPTLMDMFAKPIHLMHKAGGFQGARQMAKDSKRWLLVNIQKDAEFSSHALNRDVWRNDLVENLIQEGFIFWQEDDVHPEGHQYVERYKVTEFPHISIIDPRTGRLLWSKEGWTQQNPLTAEFFAEMAMDFCSRNSFDRPPQAPVPSKTPGNGGVPRPTGAARPVSSTDHMTEEEQIEAAVNASLNSVPQPPVPAATAVPQHDEDQKPRAVPESTAMTNGNNAGAQLKQEETEKDGEPFLQALLSVVVGSEPSTGGARIQLKMPDGKRVVRKFSPTDTVQVIFAFVAQTLNDGDNQGRNFRLMAFYPPRDLKSSMSETIEGCELKGEAISVFWT